EYDGQRPAEVSLGRRREPQPPTGKLRLDGRAEPPFQAPLEKPRQALTQMGIEHRSSRRLRPDQIARHPTCLEPAVLENRDPVAAVLRFIEMMCCEKNRVPGIA